MYDGKDLLGIQRVADVLRHGRSRWFGYLEHKNEDWCISNKKVMLYFETVV